MAEVIWWIFKWVVILSLISAVITLVFEFFMGMLGASAGAQMSDGKDSNGFRDKTHTGLNTYENSDWADGREVRVINVTYHLNNTYHIHLPPSACKDERAYENLDEKGRDVVYINGKRYVEDKRR